MDKIEVKITGTLTTKFEEAVREIPKMERLALYRAGFFLRDKIRQQLIKSVPKATTPNPRYNDTLVDAVGFTRPDGGSIIVNAMGLNRSGSGAFRARFFEGGTRDRYAKTRNGAKLKKKRFLSKIGPTHFFSNAVNANKAGVVSIIEDVIKKYVK